MYIHVYLCACMNIIILEVQYASKQPYMSVPFNRQPVSVLLPFLIMVIISIERLFFFVTERIITVGHWPFATHKYKVTNCSKT